METKELEKKIIRLMLLSGIFGLVITILCTLSITYGVGALWPFLKVIADIAIFAFIWFLISSVVFTLIEPYI